MAIDYSQLSSTKRCRERNWRARLYYPWTCTTDENPTRSLPLTIKMRQRRWGSLRTKSGYRDQLHDESSPGGAAIRRSSLTMRTKILWSDTRCPPTISTNSHRNDRICYIEQDAFLQIDTTEVDSGQANTNPARFNSVTNTYNATNSDALHPTTSSDPEVLPAMNKYQATKKCANSSLILRYYVDRQPFSLSRWQPGVPMTSTGGPQTPRHLDLEAIYNLYLFIYHLLWGEAMFIDHLCTGELDACNLNFELLRFQLGTSCW